MLKFLDSRRSPIANLLNRAFGDGLPQIGPVSKPGRRNYQVGQNERLYKQFKGTSASADSAIWNSLEGLRNRAIALEQQNPYVVSAIQEIVTSVVGEGICLQSKVPNIRGGGNNEKVSSAIEEAFAEWCQAKYSHVSGIQDFYQQQQTALYNAILSGEIFVRKINQSFGGSPVPFALENLESHQLEINYSTAKNIPDGHQIRMGVQVNQWRRPVAYWFRSYHPGDYQFTFRDYPRSDGYALMEVPASDVIHLFRRIRIQQTRGLTWLYPVLVRLFDTDEWLNWTLIDKKARAAVSGILTEAEPTEYGGEQDEAGNVEERAYLEPGSIWRLQPGESFEGFDPQGNGTGCDEYVHLMLRSIAAGLGIPVEPMSRDYSKSNYSSSRLSAIQAQKIYKSLRHWFISSYCQPVFEGFLEQAVLSGRLNLSGYEIYKTLYQKTRWHAPAFHFVDPDKETRAQERRLNMGTTTLTRELATSGTELDEYCRELEQEITKLQQVAEKVGLPKNALLRLPQSPGQEKLGAVGGEEIQTEELEDLKSLELIAGGTNGRH